MYRVVASESMSQEVPCSVEMKHGRFFLCAGGRLWTGALLLAALFLVLSLGGCSSKQVPGDHGPLVAVEGDMPAGTVYLPADDGISLSSAERKALTSTGEVDRGIASEDMRDVILHFKYYVHRDRYTIEKNLERAQPYMPFIRSVFREKGLPEELAYVAFIESGYNPMARSRTGATGMWQFISSTGKYYGMKQDWWVDERRDPYQATRAAADYLAKLYDLFDDWALAITAYNAGEGKISRGLAATGTRNFFDLRRKSDSIPSRKDRLTDENRQYYPKLVAVCKIMRNLDELGFDRPDVSRAPRIIELTARPGTDLKALAQSAGMSWDEFFVHNPACRRYVSHPGRTTRIYVPSHAADDARRFLARSPASRKGAGWSTYTVVRGDTMTRISRKTGVPVVELRRLNQINEPLRIGYKLKIPGSTGGYVDTRLARVEPAPASRKSSQKVVAQKDSGRNVAVQKRSEPKTAARKAAPGKQTRQVAAASRTPAAPARKTVVHEVKTGDTVYSLSRRYGVSQNALLAANGLSSPELRLGQPLTIPVAAQEAGGTAVAKTERTSRGKSAGKTAASAGAGNRVASYRVQPGDSLWAIARKFNMPPLELLALNKMTRETALKPGDVIRVQQ